MKKRNPRKRLTKNKTMKIPLEELRVAESEFKKATNEIEAITNRLEKVVRSLGDFWEDAGQHAFIMYYQEWRDNISGLSLLLDLVAEDINQIQARYQVADSDLTQKT